MHLGRNGPPHRFCIFGGVERALRKFLAQFVKQFLRQRVLFFSASRQCQQDLGKRLQVPSVFNCFSKLLHAELFVAVDSSEPKQEACTAREASDNVVGRSQRDIRVIGVRLLCEQSLGMFVCFLAPLQGFQVLLLEHHVCVGFHPCRQRQSKERFGVLSVFLQAQPCELSRVLDGLLKTLHSPGIG